MEYVCLSFMRISLLMTLQAAYPENKSKQLHHLFIHVYIVYCLRVFKHVHLIRYCDITVSLDNTCSFIPTECAPGYSWWELLPEHIILHWNNCSDEVSDQHKASS